MLLPLEPDLTCHCAPIATSNWHCCVSGSPVAAAYLLRRASLSWLHSGRSLLWSSTRWGKRGCGTSCCLTWSSEPWLLWHLPLCTVNQPLPLGAWRFLSSSLFFFFLNLWRVDEGPQRGIYSSKLCSLSRMSTQDRCVGIMSWSIDTLFPPTPRICQYSPAHGIIWGMTQSCSHPFLDLIQCSMGM